MQLPLDWDSRPVNLKSRPLVAVKIFLLGHNCKIVDVFETQSHKRVSNLRPVVSRKYSAASNEGDILEFVGLHLDVIEPEILRLPCRLSNTIQSFQQNELKADSFLNMDDVEIVSPHLSSTGTNQKI